MAIKKSQLYSALWDGCDELRGGMDASQYKDYQMVVAGVKSIDPSVYDPIIKKHNAKIIYDETYELLQQSELAIVCSGTATLETGLLRVPQVVVYMISGGWLVHRFLELFIRVPYISLVNLIVDILYVLVDPRVKL